MKLLACLALLLFSINGQLMAQTKTEVTCQTVGIASCVNEEGMCLEFVEMEGSDPDMWQGICSSFDAEYVESPCDQSKVVMTCINNKNMMMPISRFNDGYDLESATLMCTMLGGEVCQ